MAINVSCPGCRMVCNVADDFAGNQVWCAICHQMVTVPSVAATPDVEPIEQFTATPRADTAAGTAHSCCDGKHGLSR